MEEIELVFWRKMILKIDKKSTSMAFLAFLTFLKFEIRSKFQVINVEFPSTCSELVTETRIGEAEQIVFKEMNFINDKNQYFIEGFSDWKHWPKRYSSWHIFVFSWPKKSLSCGLFYFTPASKKIILSRFCNHVNITVNSKFLKKSSFCRAFLDAAEYHVRLFGKSEKF